MKQKRDWKEETTARVEYIRHKLSTAHADGIVVNNSGGKDCALVLILAKMATDNVLSIKLPAGTKQNQTTDISHSDLLTEKFGIKSVQISIKDIVNKEIACCNNTMRLAGLPTLSPMAEANVAPRIRMTTAYSIAQTLNYLVAGTGNACETYVGYFTKHGDGACDFNPISDLMVSEIYEYLAYLGCPEEIIKKKPSAGLYEGQTDEDELGLTYAEIEIYLRNIEYHSKIDELLGVEKAMKIRNMHMRTKHKRNIPSTFDGDW